jgi:hypothetical protein
MGTVVRLLRLLVLALLVDAVVPSVGAFTARLVVEVESEPAASGDASRVGSAETEMEPGRTERPFQLGSSAGRFVAEGTPLADGHAPPPFRPPIAT